MYAIVPAGGIGSRLWPLSRRSSPKFLRDLEGRGRTMLQTTLDRLAPVSEGAVVVTGAAHAGAVTRQLEGTAAEVVAEPSPRDSMAAIGLAAAILHERHGDVIVGSFAADHAIADADAFRRAVRRAEAIAATGKIVTIGITPTSPSSAYGYIEAGRPLSAPLQGLEVVRFEEKPVAATAAAYLTTGRYLWNAGMFVMRSAVLLDVLEELHPEMHAGLARIAAAWDTDRREDVLGANWERLPKMVIDRAVAEPMADRGGVAVVPAEMGWTDIGDFDALADLAPAAPSLAIDSPDSYAQAAKPVVVVGIPGAVVVETEDTILVTTRAKAQDVKHAVDGLDGDLEALR
ncbi:MAG TPA: sugar phosphate nucleotidyltransferase [Actinomycetaceae bacterium]|nr:sugar phosphate nucleotidyltransferase [Actinomycetaceae bacterium]